MPSSQQRDDVRIELLGGFRVASDGREVARVADAARRRSSCSCSRSPTGGGCARDQVIEQLWPHLGADAGGGEPAQGRAPRPPGARRPGRRSCCAAARRAVPGPAGAHRRRALPARGRRRAGAATRRPARAVAASCARRAAARRALRGLDPGAAPPRPRPARRAAAPLRRLGGARRRSSRRRSRLPRADARGAGRRPPPRGDPLVRAAAARAGARARRAARRRDAARCTSACTAGIGLGEPAFVGRVRELAAAMAALARAAIGRDVRAASLRGPPGIGKSALAREIAQRARERRLARREHVAPRPPARRTRRSSAAVEQLLADGHGALGGAAGAHPRRSSPS